MPVLDVSMAFDKTPKSITGTSDVVSTDVFNAGAAKKLFEGITAMPPVLSIGIKITGGTSPTIRVRFTGADDAALTTNPVIIADTGVISLDDAGSALASGAVLYRELVLRGQKTAKQYYGAIYTQGGTTPTADVTAVVCLVGQSNMPYKKAAVP